MKNLLIFLFLGYLLSQAETDTSKKLPVFDLSKGFPCITTKKLHLKSIIHELLWFLQGDTNIKYLKDNGVRIWEQWADEN